MWIENTDYKHYDEKQTKLNRLKSIPDSSF